MSVTLGSEFVRREIGTWDCGRPGPTLLVIAGVHGNEPAGVLAARAVLDEMHRVEMPIAGRVIALAGNVEALACKQRYVDRDLNRGWSETAIDAVRSASDGEQAAQQSVEDAQQLELLSCFEHVIATASGPVVVADLHTSSAGGPPFLCLADTIDNRRLGLATGIPIILGIEEAIDGASLEWFADRGIVSFAVEGGQHDDPRTITNHQAVLWRMLDYLRMLPESRGGSADFDLGPWIAQLSSAVGSVPPIVEIVYRHAIASDEGFRMEPGFTNFQPVKKGTLLARDREREIRAPRSALVMLPLYQRLGDDGFFLARRIHGFWLQVARALRAMRFDLLILLLPGVKRDRTRARTILVHPRVARWLVTEVFHLLGFRKRCMRDGLLSFTRRTSRPENRRLGR